MAIMSGKFPKAASERISSIAATASRSALPRWPKPGSGRTARNSIRSRSSRSRPAPISPLVTAPAGADLAALHHRVPVTIAPADLDRWLDGRTYDAETVMELLVAPEEGEFAWHEISTRVNRVANDDAQLILPITAEEMAAEAPGPAKRAPRKQAAAAPDDGQGSLF